ncbi:transposase [Streptomyces flaveus]|uniref:transposase n=1 Tax=Streptomyces flaveus TaxID=66370 RepID=UPI001BC914FA|nr:transposase [Streptomyces flaveus]
MAGAERGRVGRFATAAAFANYTGVAPVEIASADKARHRSHRADPPALLQRRRIHRRAARHRGPRPDGRADRSEPSLRGRVAAPRPGAARGQA